MRDPRAAVITGVGVVTPIGIGRQPFWDHLIAGRAGIAPIEGFPLPPESQSLGAEVREFVPRDFISAAHLRRMDKLSRMIVAASRLALDDGGIDLCSVPPDRVGIVVGSAFGNVSESFAYLERLWTRGPAVGASPLIFPNLVMNAPASYTAMELGARGVNVTISQGETSGEHAVLLGIDLIRSGRADVAVVGGGDELAPIPHEVYRRLRMLSSQRGGPAWSSPYDLDRNGIILGEGAAMLVIESAARAAGRGGRVYAECEQAARFSVSAPAHGWPTQARAALPVLRHMLCGEEISPCQPDIIFGAANSTRRLDACELDLFGRLMGETASKVWLASLKGAVGELGAAGALNVAAACLALASQRVPPLCSLRQPEPASPFRFARAAVNQRLTRALVCGIARGGSGAALSLTNVP